MKITRAFFRISTPTVPVENRIPESTRKSEMGVLTRSPRDRPARRDRSRAEPFGQRHARPLVSWPGCARRRRGSPVAARCTSCHRAP